MQSTRGAPLQEAALRREGLALPATADVLHTFDQSLVLVRRYNSSLKQNRQVEDMIAGLAEEGLERLRHDPGARLSSQHILGLEAVIRADGSRPSLLLSASQADIDHPMAKQWRDQLVATCSRVERIAGATGRVQPRHGSRERYFGSSFLFDRERGLVLTNRHVALALLRKAVTKQTAISGKPLVTKFVLYGHQVEVEFDGELNSNAGLAVPVTEIFLPPWPWSAQQPTMDIAVLRLAFVGDALPEAVSIVPSADFEQAGVLTSVCTVGFPGPPRLRMGMADGIDWTFVDRALFGEEYGVKRLAPGLIHRSPSINANTVAALEFGHDATTLGGSSGSGIFSWLDGGASFGIHFSGANADTNRAHCFAAASTHALLEQLDILPT